MNYPAAGAALLLAIALAPAFVLVARTLKRRRALGPRAVDSRIGQLRELGSDAGRGNLLGLQPWMATSDYADAGTLLAKLSGYFDAAQALGWLNAKTIVVAPEYIGAWLVAANEPAGAYRQRRIQPAMAALALEHPAAFLRWFSAPGGAPDKARWALFTAKAEDMARDYQAVFSALARTYGVTLVAGSIVLPEPSLVDGRIQIAAGGALRNVSAVFAPDGEIVAPLVVKVHLIESELGFLEPGRAEDIPTFATPAGRLAVLVCADAWFDAAYRRIAEQDAELLAVPSFTAADGAWSEPWSGYSGAPTPGDVDPADLGGLTEGEAWLKYGMGGRAAAANIRAGMNVFLRGRLWDLGSDGATISMIDGAVSREPDHPGAVLVNQWL